MAGALRAPWRWEKLIVDSAVIGGDPERWRRRLKGLRGEYEEQLREAQREDPDSARAGQLERDIANLSHLAGFALPVIDTLASWPRIGDVGRVAGALQRAGAACAPALPAGAARARRAAADGGDRPGDARRGTRHSRGTPAHARRAAAGQPLRLRLRRHSAAAARPRLQGRVRAVAGRAAVSADAARGSDAARRRDARAARRGPLRPGGSPQERAPDAAAGGRGGDVAAVALLSAARRQRRAAAGAVVLHARRHARRDRPHSEPRGAAARRGHRRRRAPRLAGAGGSLARHRRRRARPLDAARADRGRRSRRRSRACALPARPERVAAAIGGPPLGAGAVALAPAGRPGRAERRHQADARDAAAGRAALLGVGAPEVHALPVSVRALRDLPAAAEPGAGAAAAARSADQGIDLPRGAGALLPRHARRRTSAGHRRRREPTR